MGGRPSPRKPLEIVGADREELNMTARWTEVGAGHGDACPDRAQLWAGDGQFGGRGEIADHMWGLLKRPNKQKLV
jgi:hypothetical protein